MERGDEKILRVEGRSDNRKEKTLYFDLGTMQQKYAE